MLKQREMSDTRRETGWLTERTVFGVEIMKGNYVTGLSLEPTKRSGSVSAATEGQTGHSLTFSTNADFKHPGAETVPSWHTEALVSGVVFRAHEYITRGCKAVRLDAFHLHVFHIG